MVEMYDGKPYPLVPVGAGKFRDAEGIAINTFAGRDGQTLTYYEVPTDFEVVGERRAQWKPRRADLAGAVGRYCTPEVPVCWSLLLVGDTLVLRRAGFPDRNLSPAFADAFSLIDEDEIGSRSMRLVLQRAHYTSIHGFSISRGRVTGLLLKRDG